MEFLETGYPEPSDEYLRPTEFFDYDKPIVADFAAKAIEGATTDKEKAIKAFYAVRDSVRYDPYRISHGLTRQATCWKPAPPIAFPRHRC